MDLGTVSDVSGQMGQAISYTADYTDCGMQPYLNSANLPAGADWTVPDGLFSYEVFQTPYWTNQNPPRGQNPPSPPATATRAPVPADLPGTPENVKGCGRGSGDHGKREDEPLDGETQAKVVISR